MKKILLTAAAAMAVAPVAMASKARVDALNNSRQIVDIQHAFERPYQFMQIDTQVTFEWGGRTAVDNAAPAADQFKAEGGMVHKTEERAYGFYLGRNSADFGSIVSEANNLTGGLNPLMVEQNSLSLFYAQKMGDWIVGGTVKHAQGKNDDNGAGVTDQKVGSTGISLGATNGQWEVELTQGFSGKTEATALGNSFEVESKGLTKIGVGYKLNDTMQVYGNYSMVKADADLAGTEISLERNAYQVGFVNTIVSNEDMNVFYGVAYQAGKDKFTPSGGPLADEEYSYLPVWMGVEANATSWLVVRGSIQQNVFINSMKTGSDDADLDSMVFKAGLGAKLGKGLLDMSIATAEQGNLGFNDDIFSQVAYTHWF